MLVLPFWYWLAQVVLEKRLLNGCSSSSGLVVVVVFDVFLISSPTFFTHGSLIHCVCV